MARNRPRVGLKRRAQNRDRGYPTPEPSPEHCVEDSTEEVELDLNVECPEYAVDVPHTNIIRDHGSASEEMGKRDAKSERVCDAQHADDGEGSHDVSRVEP